MPTNKNSVVRLSNYKKVLYRFRALGYVKIFSNNLAEETGVLPSQVRKDFSIFRISGNKRGGYCIHSLIERLNAILGKDQLQKVIVVGAGNIGTALMKYKGFENEGIKIAACFDTDPLKNKKKNEVPILPFKELKNFVRSSGIKIGIIAVPDIAAQQVLDAMQGSGIKGVLNFAPIRLRSAEDVVVNNVNLELELENVIYFVNALEKNKGIYGK